MSFNYIIKYPFSNKAKEYLETKNIDLFSVNEETIKKATMFLLKTISQKTQENEKQWREYLRIDDERIARVFASLYPISRLLLNVVDYNPLYQKFGEYYQKQLSYYLKFTKDNDEFIALQKDICPELKYNEKTERYYLSLIEYLSLNLSDNFKLQYANLEEGNIYFSKIEVIELLSVILKKRILKNIDLEKKEMPKLFLDYGEYIKKKVISENIFDIKVINKPAIDTFPPCFLKMYNKLIGGEKLTHIENFNIAVFLFNIGYTFEELLHAFKNSPNYDEKIASYQIKKVFEKKYSVPNCDTLKSNGLCVNECNVKHPFQLFKSTKKGERKNE
jgi:DNA primase large subunit